MPLITLAPDAFRIAPGGSAATAALRTAFSFAGQLEAIRQATLTLNDSRAQRMVGTTVQSVDDAQAYLVLMPMEPGQCPPGGALDYVWADIFAGAQRNIAALVANPPTRSNGATPDTILTWSLLLEWNWLLLLDATNIRPHFLFPDLEESSGTVRCSPTDQTAPLGEDHVGQCARTVPRPEREGLSVINPLAYSLMHQFEWYQGHTSDGIQSYVTPTTGNWGQHIGLDYSVVDAAGNMVTGHPRFVRFGYYEIKAPDYGAQVAALSNWIASGGIQHVDTSTGMHDWDVSGWIAALVRRYSPFARLDLVRVVAESSAMYVYNHVQWWDAHGAHSLNTLEMQETLRQMRRQRFQAGTALTTGSAAIATGLVSVFSGIPIMGAIFSALTSIGNLFIENVVLPAFDQNQPRYLWVRVPYDATCVPADTHGTQVIVPPTRQPGDGRPAPAATGTKVGALAAGAAIGVGLVKLLLFL